MANSQQLYPPPPQDQPPNRGQHPLSNYQFSAEELRVLGECNKESFFQRSLPLGLGLGVGAYLGVKQGFFSANPKFGPVPKVVLGVILGYFVGKFSYQEKCAQKIMRLPNSQLAEIIRQRKTGGASGMLPLAASDPTIGMSPFASTEGYGDDYKRSAQQNQSSSLQLDMDTRPYSQGLDDIYRPSLDGTPQTFDADIPLETPKQSMTYDELRQKNREDYMKRQNSPYTRPVPPSDGPVVRRSFEKPPVLQEQPETAPGGQKNKYGDTWS